MKTVNVQPKVKPELCKGCKTCERVCPVGAVKVTRVEKKPNVEFNYSLCVGCWNCEQRCPEHAINMLPCEPFVLAVDIEEVDYGAIEDLCRKARFHPKQVVCYCTGSRAEELAAAILLGASTPGEVVRATGIGSGCGIECNQTILRFLEAAGKTFERDRKSYQWYGRTVTIWEIPKKVEEQYGQFRFDSDRDLLEKIVNAGVDN